ncbi:MAG: hypothetical protein QOF74_3728 [Caballeronia mineralivorans]|nr:hypothetical protein [Caballeronia mineralivorans]
MTVLARYLLAFPRFLATSNFTYPNRSIQA